MKKIVILVVVIFIGYGAYNYYMKLKQQNFTKKEYNNRQNYILYQDNLELSYIIDVINNGSNRLFLKGGEMEGGFVPKSKAKDVACYILDKRGTLCKGGFSKDAALFYSSNCAGCHGIDMKGIKGSFPNLLHKPFLGFQKWLKEKNIKEGLK